MVILSAYLFQQFANIVAEVLRVLKVSWPSSSVLVFSELALSFPSVGKVDGNV